MTGHFVIPQWHLGRVGEPSGEISNLLSVGKLLKDLLVYHF